MQDIRLIAVLTLALTTGVGCGGDGSDSDSDSGSGGSGAASGGAPTSGGSPAVGGGSATGGASSNPADYDTSIAEGEFSFFVVSLDFIRSKAACSGETCLGGLGGDLRNGKANGIDGADSLCAEAAALANPGDNHLWRAFLSASDYNGAVLNAIDRVGEGPWYSAPPREQGLSNYANEGLLVATSPSELTQRRPPGDTTTIVYVGVNQSRGSGSEESWPFSQCLTNELGFCVQEDGDTHDTLTGSTAEGLYAGSTDATCDDWTNSTKDEGAPAFGHSWPRQLDATDGAADWINTGEAGEIACGAIINVGTQNYISGGGMGGPPGGGDTTYAGGVGSAGGYGAFYCLAYSMP